MLHFKGYMRSLKKSEKGGRARRRSNQRRRGTDLGVLGKGGGDDARGRMPRCLPSPQGPEHVPEDERVDRRGEEGVLRSKLHQLALLRLLASVVFGRSLTLACLRRHGNWEGMKDRGQWGRSGSGEQRRKLRVALEEEECNSGSKIGKGAEGDRKSVV